MLGSTSQINYKTIIDTYNIGTSQDTLKQKYIRTQFIPPTATFIEALEVTPREVARNDSFDSGQG